MKTSKISGFYKLSVDERLKIVKEFANLTDEEIGIIRNTGCMDIEQVDRMIENVIGAMEVPLGIAVNFLINGKDYLIPMAIEEPSVVAAASYAAKLARVKGGFTAQCDSSTMIGQIQLTNVRDPNYTSQVILSHKDEILKIANSQDSTLVKLGGGAKDIKVRVIDSFKGKMIIIHLLVDCLDAMGANAVNTMCEAVAPYIESITDGRVYLRIISNLAKYRIARARAIFDKDAIGGDDVVEGILQAYAFALSDPYRAATHNKGIMNGIVAVALATANDTRALEAGAHAYAAIQGYKPLTTYEKNKDGDLVATIELPIAAGIIGGATRVHPVARVCLKILDVKSAKELAEVMASVGLAQNFAALRALATEGIQRGHMELHARNLAASIGAKGEEIDIIAEKMAKEKKISMQRAKEILEEIRKQKIK